MQDREAVARREVGHTNVTPGVARALATWFLVTLALLPASETIAAAAANLTRASTWSHLSAVPSAIRERLGAISAGPRAPSRWRQLIASNRALLEQLSAFESALEDQSAIGQALRPHAQQLLSGALGGGNERVYVGRDGWLFYRPDVEFVTGRGFLEPTQLQRRVASAREYERRPQPDPRPAIAQFARDLHARGIALVVVPVPGKPRIHHEKLWPRGAAGDYRNPSEAEFTRWLQQEGVLVFDPAAELGREPLSTPQYLATDTHWRPDAMQRVAAALATYLTRSVSLRPVAPAGLVAEPREAQQVGDTAAMLDLPAGQQLYPSERVALRFVTDTSGEPWRATRRADVLLLGDSFTNIYSLGSMGWGESAGLAEQLSYELQRPVDRIVQNDQAAYATRDILRRELALDPERLAATRVVVWQFAARELAFGDWRVIELPR